VPNLAAGSLASSRSRLVAIFLPTIANSIFSDTVQALTERMAAAGYQTLLGLTGYSPEQEEALLEAVLGRRPDGIVLTGTEHTQASRERLARVGIPLVEAWDLCEHPVDMLVGFSHEAVGQAVAHYLIGKGYRRVSFVGIDDPRGLRRYRSLLQALQERVQAPVAAQILPAPATLAIGRQGLARLLQDGAAGEVVVCSSDTVAQGGDGRSAQPWPAHSRRPGGDGFWRPFQRSAHPSAAFHRAGRRAAHRLRHRRGAAGAFRRACGRASAATPGRRLRADRAR
jgi:LacI family gluconate utilization system Gnt-I transcriptional repressor